MTCPTAIALQPLTRLRSPIWYFGGKGDMRARILPLFPNITRIASRSAVRTRNSGLQGTGAALKELPRTECIWMNFQPSVSVVVLKNQFSLF